MRKARRARRRKRKLYDHAHLLKCAEKSRSVKDLEAFRRWVDERLGDSAYDMGRQAKMSMPTMFKYLVQVEYVKAWVPKYERSKEELIQKELYEFKLWVDARRGWSLRKMTYFLEAERYSLRLWMRKIGYVRGWVPMYER